MVTAALNAQDLISKKLGRNCPTLAQAVRDLRSHLSQGLQRKIDVVDKAASYVRHHGATVDHNLSRILVSELDKMTQITETNTNFSSAQSTEEITQHKDVIDQDVVKDAADVVVSTENQKKKKKKLSVVEPDVVEDADGVVMSTEKQSAVDKNADDIDNSPEEETASTTSASAPS
eukprot:TRINITY_DN32144_c0_g1_i2.p1 TRINITY_DN32144_c0_g1~~TRINITY_DN32144_c0_g1_i2.p1  ORF type:complete len:175 (-),score=42.97 TRINITY_DN32144_c0_g1_i2:334-858(-)